jgi:colanic acid biosynthesis glycosyl transferase WcaI
MKVLITGLNFSPELTGIGRYTGELAEWLAAAGVEVRVVAAPPYYPQWSVATGYAPWAYRVEQVGGAKVYRCPLYVPARPSGFRRVIHLLSFALSSAPVLLWHGLAWRPDVVFAVEPPLSCAPVAWLAARLGGAAAWLHVQDFELDAAFELGMLRSPRARAVLNAIERWLLRRFDRVSTISHRMVARLGRKGVAPERAMLFPNWTDFSRIYPYPHPSPLRVELDIPAHSTVLLYSGTLGSKQGLELLPAALRALPAELGVTLVVCGEGPAAAAVRAAAAGLTNVRFLPLQPIDRLNDLMNLADIHALPQRADAEDLVMPSKLTTMLASGRAVVACASAGSEVARVLDGAGVVVDPGDPAAFAVALAGLVADPGRRAQLGLAGRARAIANWDADGVLGAAFGVGALASLGVVVPTNWPGVPAADAR